ncbi:hypothetical protein VC159_03480 [Polynucleobacter sp. JS-JIR-II-c23]|uniref:hypothetical protein n=1 Tax=Polynucleobacter sp. JS-JIR-II-c23 TaxID=1758393 RepID=UPI002B2348B3|nr:hypothetical protein [Polynucleobacter sp. JS-JIR-II-c23]MEA9603513.1 hypothetical protein [Polynucleobacter sp. JS-JIR-II-c23]
MNMKLSSSQDENLARLMKHPRFHELNRITDLTVKEETQNREDFLEKLTLMELNSVVSALA